MPSMKIYAKLPVFAVVAWFLIIFQSASAQEVTPNDAGANFRFAAGRRSTLKIPFELDNNLIFLRARINQSAPLWFLLDTGADVSVVKRSRAESLGLQFEGGDGQTGASGGTVGFSNLKNVVFKLPGADVLNPTVVAIPLESAEPRLGRAVDGILGADIFNRFVVEIDYAARLINLYDARNFQYSGRGEIVPLTITENIPFVKAQIAQTNLAVAEGIFEIDTGANSTVVLNSPFVKAHDGIEPPKTIALEGIGIGGATCARLGRLEELRLANFVLKNPLARFSHDEKGELASREFSGLLGGELLRRFRVIFDYARRRMILEANRHFSEPDEFEMSGAAFTADAPNFNVFKVRQIIENSPAAQAGLLVGDVLTAIDGIPRRASRQRTPAPNVQAKQSNASRGIQARRKNAARENHFKKVDLKQNSEF